MKTNPERQSRMLLQAKRLSNFLDVFSEVDTCCDLGPRLTCVECEALARLLEVHGEHNAATALRAEHVLQDDEGDMLAHVRLRNRIRREEGCNGSK